MRDLLGHRDQAALPLGLCDLKDHALLRGDLLGHRDQVAGLLVLEPGPASEPGLLQSPSLLSRLTASSVT